MAALNSTHPPVLSTQPSSLRDIARRAITRPALLLAVALALLAPLSVADAGVRGAHPNLIGSELLGRGMLTLNYERMVTQDIGVGGSFGLGGSLYVSHVTGNAHSLYLSLGGGEIPPIFGNDPAFLLQGTVGYQFQSMNGFFVRPMITAFQRRGDDTVFHVWPGLTMGGSF
jgi:hypothetical protein